MDWEKQQKLMQFIQLNTRWTQLYPGFANRISRLEEIEDQLGDMTRRGEFPDAAQVIDSVKHAKG